MPEHFSRCPITFTVALFVECKTAELLVSFKRYALRLARAMAFAWPVYSKAAGAAGAKGFEKVVLALNSILQDHSSLVIKTTIPVEIYTGMDTGTGAAESPETFVGVLR